VIDAERAIGWVEKKFGVTLAASQRAAVALALANKLLVVTGGPGVGLCDRFTAMTEALAKILPDLTPEEEAKYDGILQRFAEFGSRNLAAQVDFSRLWEESITREEQLQAISRAAAALERDIEELKGFIRESQEIVKAVSSR
jgi:ATP-dependent exoDNAse (exonuclease V) alpha subunit